MLKCPGLLMTTIISKNALSSGTSQTLICFKADESMLPGQEEPLTSFFGGRLLPASIGTPLAEC